MSMFYLKTELTGGGEDALDGINGDVLAEGDRAIVVTDENVFFYYLGVGLAYAGDGFQYVEPDKNPGVKLWVLAVMPAACRTNIVGGTQSYAVSDNDEYDPDAWTARTSLSVARRYAAGASIASIGKGYVFCGNAYTQDTLEYGQDDTWASKTDCPSPGRYNPTATDISGKAYLFGGYGSSAYLINTDEFLPGENVWSSLTNMPIYGRQLAGSATVDDKAYLFAGKSSYGAMLDTDEYAPDTWTSKTNIPIPARMAPAAAAIGDKAYIFSGYDGSNNIYDTDQYDPDTWTSKTNLPAPARRYHTASGFGGSAYIVGGYGGGFLTDNDEYCPDTWTNKTALPSPARYGHADFSMW